MWSVEVFFQTTKQIPWSNRPSQPALFLVRRRQDHRHRYSDGILYPNLPLAVSQSRELSSESFFPIGMQQILAKVSEICCTIQGTNISHLWKMIKSWTQGCFGKGYVIASWRVSLWILNSSRCWGACDCQITLGEGFKMTLVNGK